MKKILLSVVSTLVCITPAVAQTLFDDFSSGSLDTATWTARNSGGASAPSVSGGVLNVQVSATTSGQRSFVETKASDFNFFTNPLTITVDVASSGGENASASSFSDHYVMISSLTGAEKGYVVSNAGPGVYATFGDVNGTSTVQVGTIRGGSFSTTNRTYTGTLEQFVFTIDSTGFELTASGSGGFALSSAMSGTWTGIGSSISEGDFSSLFYLTLGVDNRSTQTTAPTASYDSIEVVPEPSTYVLLGFGAIALLALAARRRRQS